MGAERSRELPEVLERLLRFGFGITGVVSVASGVWMLIDPRGWFQTMPGVSDFAPYNSHFVMDLGGWWLGVGILLLFALSNPLRFGGVALIVATVGSGSHAVTHIQDISRGTVGAKHWIVDAPFVFLPVIVFIVMIWIWWTLQSGLYPNARPALETEDLEEFHR